MIKVNNKTPERKASLKNFTSWYMALIIVFRLQILNKILRTT